ncbi:hypothetical protein K523DRAFT_256857, partial [Schizophyllum commune Tattone D]
MVSRKVADERLIQYRHFLDTLESPVFDNVQAHRRFLAKAMEFFVQDGVLFRKHPRGAPQKVILEPEDRLRILEEAHD